MLRIYGGVVLEKVDLNVMYFACGGILGIYLLYLMKVKYVDNINRNRRFSDEADFNKPDKKLIAENERLNNNGSDVIEITQVYLNSPLYALI